jgi:hypothetical protein
MRKAEARGWTKKSAPCYVERHHIFIKAIFGENGRVVYLTAREHFIAHLLLWKACRKRYGVQHWKTAKTGKSVQAMSMKSQFTESRYILNSHQFEVARVANVESMLGDNHWSRQDGAVSPFVTLNKDPVRAKRIGEKNGEREKEKAARGEHQWQNPETIARLVQQRKDSGVLAENGKKTKGKLWWNNGTEHRREYECPGEGWIRGRLPGIDYSHKDPLIGDKNPMARAIYLTKVSTGETEFFGCIADAIRKYSIKNISLVLLGMRKTAKGFTATYANEEKH